MKIEKEKNFLSIIHSRFSRCICLVLLWTLYGSLTLFTNLYALLFLFFRILYPSLRATHVLIDKLLFIEDRQIWGDHLWFSLILTGFAVNTINITPLFSHQRTVLYRALYDFLPLGLLLCVVCEPDLYWKTHWHLPWCTAHCLFWFDRTWAAISQGEKLQPLISRKKWTLSLKCQS